MKAFVKRLLRAVGYRCMREDSLPRGLDALMDLRQLPGFGPIHAVIDVGANVGQTCRQILAAAPDARVVACEPAPGAFAVLQRHFERDRRIVLENIALGATAGPATFRVVDTISGLNHLEAADHPHQSGSTINVNVDTLDRLLLRHSIAVVDILKIDTEGFEMAVLAGGERTFAEGRIRAVLAECTFSAGDRGHTTFEQLHRWLEPKGLSFLGLYDVHHERRALHYCNALFVLADPPPANLEASRNYSGEAGMTSSP